MKGQGSILETKKKMLYENVAREMLELINKNFSVGDKIPNEMELAEKFQVGRNTIREAVRFLVLHGVLEVRRGRGTYISSVKRIENDTIFDDISNLKIEIKDMFETRLAIEPQIAYYVAKRASDKELKKIDELCAVIEYGFEHNNQNRFKDEVAFHVAIVRAAKNEFMMKLIPVIKECIDKALKYEYKEEVILSSSIQDHRILVEFLLARDAESAKYAMRNHITRCMHNMNIEID
jgi:DNA-binding FadR family transcriptional regulator